MQVGCVAKPRKGCGKETCRTVKRTSAVSSDVVVHGRLREGAMLRGTAASFFLFEIFGKISKSSDQKRKLVPVHSPEQLEQGR